MINMINLKDVIEKTILEYDETLRYKTKSASNTFGNGSIYRYDNTIICNAGSMAKEISEAIMKIVKGEDVC